MQPPTVPSGTKLHSSCLCPVLFSRHHGLGSISSSRPFLPQARGLALLQCMQTRGFREAETPGPQNRTRKMRWVLGPIPRSPRPGPEGSQTPLNRESRSIRPEPGWGPLCIPSGPSSSLSQSPPLSSCSSQLAPLSPTDDSGGATQAGGICLISVNGQTTFQNTGIKELARRHQEEADIWNMGLHMMAGLAISQTSSLENQMGRKN